MLYDELHEKMIALDTYLGKLRESGIKKAETERDYKIILTQRVLENKEKEKATVLGLMIYGLEDVARLRYERDIAEVEYNAIQEAINILKLQIKIIQNQIDKEWN